MAAVTAGTAEDSALFPHRATLRSAAAAVYAVRDHGRLRRAVIAEPPLIARRSTPPDARLSSNDAARVARCALRCPPRRPQAFTPCRCHRHATLPDAAKAPYLLRT